MKIETLLKSHPALNYAYDLREICAPLDFLNIVYFSHAHIDHQNNLSGLGLVPDFFKLYLEKGYYNFDLHMAPKNQQEEYIIWDTIKRKHQSHSLHQDFMSFNQGHTFSIVINHASGKDCYHFATQLGNEQMNGEYLQLVGSLKKFISYFKEKIANHKQLFQAYNLKIPLQTKQGGFLTEDFLIDINHFNEKIATNRIYTPAGNQYLTKRELECLFWFAKGKTMEETAMILGIRTRTVNAHVLSMKEKLGCINQFQLGMQLAKFV